jgi:hypothetical protein
MQVQYISCNPLDAIGLVPHAIYRLRFVPQNRVLPDSWMHSNWPVEMKKQLERISDSRYLYAAQGEPTIVDDKEHGRAGVVDTLAFSAQGATSIQTAASAVEDSFALAKLFSVERIAKLTQTDLEQRPEEQKSDGEAAAKAEKADSPQSIVKRYAGWAILILALGVVAIVAIKAPRFDK